MKCLTFICIDLERMKIQNNLVKFKNYKIELLKKGFRHIDCVSVLTTGATFLMCQ